MIHIFDLFFSRTVQHAPKILLFVALGFSTGCGGCLGSPTSFNDISVPGDGADGTSSSASIDFAFVTQTGEKGLGEENVVLTDTDEPEVYASLEGFQTDIRVATYMVENAQQVSLYIKDLLVGEALVVVDPSTESMEGSVLFNAINLSNDATGYEVRIETTTQSGDVVSETKTLIVDTGACAVSLLPANTGCLSQDADDSTSGYQVEFTVVSTPGSCDQAELDLTIDSVPVETQNLPLDPSGQAKFVITISDSPEVDGVNLSAIAKVSDSADPSRTGVSNPIEYTADNAPPKIQITEPVKELLSLADDLDGDPANGIQTDIAGTVTGQSTENTLTLWLDGTELGTTTADGDGAFRFANVNLTQSGSYTLRVTTSDACSNEGEDSRALDVVASQAGLTVMSPPNGSTLYAKDDGELTTLESYEVAFDILAVDLLVGYELLVECTETADPGVYVTVGSTTIESASNDNRYGVDTTLNRQSMAAAQMCRARYLAPTQSSSDDVSLTVALPAPLFILLSPAASAVTKESSIDLVASTQHLDGQPATVTLSLGAGPAIIESEVEGAIENDGFNYALDLTSGGIPLPDGTYSLKIEVDDQYGNKASETTGSSTKRNLTIDHTAPILTLVQPASTNVNPSETADSDDTTCGYQTTVRFDVNGEAQPDMVVVCLSVNEAAASCTNATPINPPEGSVEWTVTLQPGSNSLSWTATDAAGNETSSSMEVSLDSDAPRVIISSPENGAVTTSETTDVEFTVNTANGDAITGANVTLILGDQSTGNSASDNGNGSYSYSAVALAEGDNKIQVSAESDGASGCSAPTFVNYKTTLPTLAFATLEDGQILSSGSSECQPVGNSCQLELAMDATNLEVGSDATLAVCCAPQGQTCLSDSAVDYSAQMTANGLSFANVILNDQMTCTLTASASDLAGQPTTAGPISVSIDRVAPTLYGFIQPSGASLTFSNDVDLIQEGMQTYISIRAGGVESGQTINITVSEDGSEIDTFQIQVNTNVNDDDNQVFTSNIVTLKDGTLTLRAELSDAAGNVATPLNKLVEVLSVSPAIQITLPTYTPLVGCASDADCAASGGVCEANFCALKWKSGSNQSLTVVFQGIPQGRPVRLCSDAAGVTGSACQTTGFKEVASGSITGISQTLSLSSVDDGLHTFIAEAQVNPEDPWIGSLDAPQPSERSRRVYLDRIVPEVQSIICTSDTDEPTDVLNSSEKLASNGSFTIRVESSETGGSAEVFANGDSMSSAAINGTLADVAANLPEGAVSVTAVVSDRVGNTSAVSTFSYTPVVDTIAPTLSFSFPTAGLGVINSSNSILDVILSSDAVGKSITLSDGGVEVGSVPVEGDGYATFLQESFGTLSQGSHTLTATVSDNANNIATASTIPATVVVDTAPPTLQVIAPVSPAAFSQDNDAQPSVGGYQILVSFSSTDSSSWTIDLANNCDAGYSNCEGAYEAQSGTIANAGGTEADIFLTVPFGATPYHVMTLNVADENNNIVSSTVQFQINVTSCIGALVGLTPGGYVNNESCAASGSDCASTELDMKVVFTGPCSSIDNAELVILDNTTSASQTLSSAVVSGEASFSVTLTDGENLSISGEGLSGTTAQPATNTGASSVLVDLTQPSVAFVATPLGDVNTPAAGETVDMGEAYDTNLVAANLQTNLSASIDDGSGEATIISLTVGGVAVSPAFPIIPNTYSSLPVTASLDGLELSHGDDQVVVVTVSDEAGNTSSSTFTANVDLENPASVTDVVLDPASVDRRLPSITLNFTAPTEDSASGDPATTFDVRYSKNPITDGNFDSACPAIALSGTSSEIVYNEVTEIYEVTYTVAGPDPADPLTAPNCHFATSTQDTTWNFAVKAIDGAGNGSSLGVGSTAANSELNFSYARVTGTNGFTAPFDALFNFYGNSVGDLNGDGLGDFTIGGPYVSSFCIVYGRDFETTPPANGIIDIDSDSQVQCFNGEASGNLGSKTLNAGDINDDGINDLVVGYGNANFETGGGGPDRELRIYFGQSADNKPESTPSVIIRGMSNPTMTGLTNFDSANFNGDAFADIIVGSFNENKAYVIPGSDSWPPASQTIYDLQDTDDLNTLGVTTIEVNDAIAGANFGRNTAGIGDVISGGGSGTYGEVAIAMDTNPAQVVLIPGREATGAQTITISSNGGSTADDDTVVRLKSHSGADNFGTDTLNGDHDLTGDGVPDVVADHFKSVPFVGIMVFDGAAIQASVGGLHYAGIAGGASPSGDNVYQGSAGVAIGGEILKPVLLPPFDDVASSSSTWDMAAVRYDPNSGSSGEVYVRLNISDADTGWSLGQMPYNSIVFTDPDDPATAFFGQSGVFSISDFNNDGFNDLMVPVYGSTPLIIY